MLLTGNIRKDTIFSNQLCSDIFLYKREFSREDTAELGWSYDNDQKLKIIMIKKDNDNDQELKMILIKK